MSINRKDCLEEDYDFSKYYNFIWSRVHSWMRSKNIVEDIRDDLFQECFLNFLNAWRGKVGLNLQERTLYHYCSVGVDHTINRVLKKKCIRNKYIKLFNRNEDDTYIDYLYNDTNIDKIINERYIEDELWYKLNIFLDENINYKVWLFCRLGLDKNYNVFVEKELNKRRKRGGNRYMHVENIRHIAEVLADYLGMSAYKVRKLNVQFRKDYMKYFNLIEEEVDDF